MAGTPLVPKIRNLKVAGEGSYTTLSISGGGDDISTLPQTIPRLKVTQRFQPPVGADKFDAPKDTQTLTLYGTPTATVSHRETGETWATMVGGAGSFIYRLVTDQVSITSYTTPNTWYELYRSILVYDTSALPDDCTILSASLFLYGTSAQDELGIAPSINVYSAAPANEENLAAGDYDSLGSDPFCSDPISYSSWDTEGYNEFSFNAVGKANISKTGNTSLGIKNSNYDAAAVSPLWSSSLTSCLTWGSGTAEVAKRPKLVITYSTTPVVATTGYVWVEGHNIHHIDEYYNEQVGIKQSDFDANTILAATTGSTPVAKTVGEQRVVGRLTGGEIGGVTLGIADDNIVQIDHASVADNDYAKFTANGLEGRSAGEVADDIESSVEHGNLAGLSDDDHPQYIKKSLVNEKGDLIVSTADDTVTRLAVGTDDQVLTADSEEASGVKWASGSGGGCPMNVIYVPTGEQIMWETSNYDVRLRESDAVAGSNTLITQGFRMSGGLLQVWV